MNLNFFDKNLPDTEKVLGLVSINLVPVAGQGVSEHLEPTMKVLVYAAQIALLIISFIYIKRKLPKTAPKKRKRRKNAKSN